MRQLDPEKLASMPTFNQLIDDKYGKSGTETRDRFDEESMTWFYGNMLKERRKELKLTQKPLAERIGREQSYIARVENGKADIQLSSFIRIASVLGIQFVPTFFNV